jgi:hypothetical protein
MIIIQALYTIHFFLSYNKMGFAISRSNFVRVQQKWNDYLLLVTNGFVNFD